MEEYDDPFEKEKLKHLANKGCVELKQKEKEINQKIENKQKILANKRFENSAFRPAMEEEIKKLEKKKAEELKHTMKNCGCD